MMAQRHDAPIRKAKYRIKGEYTYHGQTIQYTGFLNFDRANKINGLILDEAADYKVLSCEGALKHKDENRALVIELRRQALHGALIQDTLSDPMIFTLSKRNDGTLDGEYEGTWKFAEKCFNIRVGFDKAGEKAPVFQDDSKTTGNGKMILEEIAQEPSCVK